MVTRMGRVREIRGLVGAGLVAVSAAGCAILEPAATDDRVPTTPPATLSARKLNPVC